MDLRPACFPGMMLHPRKAWTSSSLRPGENTCALRLRHGPLNIWRPPDYDPRRAGVVIYIHGYFTSVDQAWADDQLAMQFRDSGLNALFIAIEAPGSNGQDVSWKSLEDLLRTVEDRVPTPFRADRWWWWATVQPIAPFSFGSVTRTFSM